MSAWQTHSDSIFRCDQYANQQAHKQKLLVDRGDPDETLRVKHQRGLLMARLRIHS